jgi:hypothetical protein
MRSGDNMDANGTMGPWDHAYSEDMDEIPNENDMDEKDKQDEKPIRRIEKE